MTLVWGRHVWKALHYISLGYPDKPTKEEKEHYKNFFTLLKYTLPCNLCRIHYNDNLLEYPLTDDVLKNKNNLVKWVIDLHNIVNKKKGYPVLTYEQALENINSYDTIHTNNLYFYLLIILIIILIILFLNKKLIFKK